MQAVAGEEQELLGGFGGEERPAVAHGNAPAGGAAGRPRDAAGESRVVEVRRRERQLQARTPQRNAATEFVGGHEDAGRPQPRQGRLDPVGGHQAPEVAGGTSRPRQQPPQRAPLDAEDQLFQGLEERRLAMSRPLADRRGSGGEIDRPAQEPGERHRPAGDVESVPPEAAQRPSASRKRRSR